MSTIITKRETAATTPIMMPNHWNIYLYLELIVRCIQQRNERDQSGPFKFEDIKISYTNLIHKAKQRKKYLREQYYFDCTCNNCTLSQDKIGREVDQNMTVHEIEMVKHGSVKCHNCKECIAVLPISGRQY